MEHDKFGPFYSTVCHVCKSFENKNSLSDTLKKCRGCRLISYCGVDHQQKHWPQHRNFCRTIQKLIKHLNVTKIFENSVPISIPKEWCELRNNIKLLCEVTLKRSLSTCESGMLFFPPACMLCYKFDTPSSKVCSKCHCVSYCSDEHMKADAVHHSKSCNELKVGFDFDISVFHSILPDVNFDFGGRNFCQSADGFCKAFIEFSSQSNELSNQLTESLYFTVLSCPLTFIYSVYKTGLHLSEKLTVHLIGSGHFEIQHLAMWDIVFHWLPNLKHLHLVLIGPDVFQTLEYKVCSKCQLEGYEMRVEFSPGQLYHNYVTTSQFTKSDMIVMFNCGLSEFIGGIEDTWQKSIPFIMTSNCPLIITSYTAREAEDDIERLIAFDKEINVLIQCQKNIFSGKKPMRDWEHFHSHSDSLVFYHNGFISILVPKTE